MDIDKIKKNLKELELEFNNLDYQISRKNYCETEYAVKYLKEKFKEIEKFKNEIIKEANERVGVEI